jgi:hypothetical protein
MTAPSGNRPPASADAGSLIPAPAGGLAPAPATPAPQRKAALGRLILTAALFAGWIGYLVFLVVTRTLGPDGTPVVLSRPQFLVSELDVVARLEAGEGKELVSPRVRIEEVLYPDNAPVKAGDTLTVINLDLCKPWPIEKDEPAAPDFTGSGPYLLALRRASKDGETYEVVPIPPSPGYAMGPPRIYPVNPQTRAQYRQVPKPQ